MIAEWVGRFGNFALTLLIVAVYGLLVGAFIERTIAKVQGRIGIPYRQPFINILKTFVKRTAVSHGIMFYLGPVFRIAGGIGTLAFIPVIYGSEVEHHAVTDRGALENVLQNIDERLRIGNPDAPLHLGDDALDEGAHDQAIGGDDQQGEREIADLCQPGFHT